MFSSIYLTSIKDAWMQMAAGENFFKNGAVRNFVADSWKRCLEYGVDPYTQKLTNDIYVHDIDGLIKQYEELIRISRPFMLSLHQFVAGSGFLVALADGEGTMLELLGDDEVVELSRKSNLDVGLNFNEKNIGTNTLGTIIVERVPLQIVGEEHYCRIFHGWTCSAAPIFASSGELLGVLNMSGSSEQVHSHTLGMVVAAAKAIENEIRLHETYQELCTSYQYLQTIINTISEGLISVNAAGNVTHINSIAREILNLKEEDQISPFDPYLNIIHSVLQSGQEIINKEVINKRTNTRYILTVIPMLNNQGIMSGAVAILRESSKVHRFVTNIVGAKASFNFEDLIGQSGQFKRTVSLAKEASQSNSTILLQGESGTGKDLLAQAIHNSSSREKGPYVAVNCAAIPRELVGSELFGYEEGAFTGAKKGGRPGKFELASGGTIFLDEIGDMPLDLQVNLLRVLDEKCVHRLGGRGAIQTNVRVIAATNKNLGELIRQGAFRADLYYRLSVLLIDLPSLRNRENDIILLAQYFIAKLNRRLHKNVSGLTPEAETTLKRYSWPGNIRELQNVLERAMHYTKQNILTMEHFPDLHTQGGRWQKSLVEEQKTLKEEHKTLKDVEREVITNALRKFDHNISKTAEVLGIARNTLYKKIKEWS